MGDNWKQFAEEMRWSLEIEAGATISDDEKRMIIDMADRIEQLEREKERRRAKAAEAKMMKAVEKERERCARVLDRHEGVPCKPLASSGWSDDFRDGYETGQMDAALSWQAAIRRGEDG